MQFLLFPEQRGEMQMQSMRRWKYEVRVGCAKNPKDIFPGNVCLCDLCPYQEYLSCYWSDYDQNFNSFELSLILNVDDIENLKNLDGNWTLKEPERTLPHMTLPRNFS